jgi:hypothetical protein
VAALRADGQANSDLARARGDRVLEEPVDPDGGDQERGGGEPAQQPGLKPAHGGSNGPRHPQRVLPRCSYEYGPDPGRILRQRLEHLRDRFVLHSLAPHVAHDTHPRETTRADFEFPAYWIVPRPQMPGHRLIEDRHPRSLRPIRGRKEASAKQKSPGGLEESSANLVSSEAQTSFRVPLDHDGPPETSSRIASASVATAVTVKPGLFRSVRTA